MPNSEPAWDNCGFVGWLRPRASPTTTPPPPPPSSPFLSTSLPQPFLFSFSACCFRVSRGMLIHGPLRNREHRQLEAGQSRHRPSAGAVSHFACIIFNFGLRACSASRGRTGAYLVSFCCSPRSTGAWGSSLFSLERIMHEPIG